MSTKHNSKQNPQNRVEDEDSGKLETPSRIMMFYDGGCPLCSREVAHYRRLDAGGRIAWIDIHENPWAIDSIGVNHGDAMARLHVRDRAGVIQTGVRAFAAVWDALPYYRWLAWILRALRLLPVLDLAYTHFARWRLKRRACASDSCTRT